MRLLISPITNRRRSVTKRSRSIPLDDQNSNLTSLHYQILQWVQGRRAGDTPPQIDGLSAFSLDTTVAELVLRDLIEAVSIPQKRYGRARWEPTGLTHKGWRTLLRHRRTLPRPIAHSSQRLRIWG